MNQAQIAQQIKYLLQVRTWDDDPSNAVVFGKVVVSNKPMEYLLTLGPTLPFAAVRMGAMVHDPDFPEVILDEGIEVEVSTRIENDPWGESDLIGGVRPSLLVSQGRGVSEIVAQVHATISRNDPETGISMHSRTENDGRSIQIQNSSYMAQSVEVTAKGGIDLFFAPGRELANSGNTITWTNPAIRFDTHSMILRYAAGSTPPATATAGSAATLSGVLATTYTHGDDGQPGGTFSYALFVAYDYNFDGTIDEYSASTTLTAAF